MSLKGQSKYLNDIQEYEFKSFQNVAIKNSNDIETFDFVDLTEAFEQKSRVNDEVLKLERESADHSQFEISPVVKEFRGINDQEAQEKEREISYQVEKRVAEIQEKAFQMGYDEGINAGKQEVFEQTKNETEEKLKVLQEMIAGVVGMRDEVLEKQRLEIYKVVKDLTKWVTLKEFKDDDKYLERLLEKLVLEIQTKSDLLIKVNKKDFEKMPDILETVQKKLGEFPNLRVEIDYEIEHEGMILDCENGIINATLEEQFKSIDKLFESIGLSDENE